MARKGAWYRRSMTHAKELHSLSDDELLERLSGLVSRSKRIEAELIAHIAEVDERKLYLREAAPSMFSYACDVLHLSEPEAYLRIAVARASRKHPVLLEMLADGRLHLSGIDKLAPHLTEENCDSLLARAAHKSKRQIEEIVADLSPRPDVPASVRKLPTRPVPTSNAPRPIPTAQLGPDPVVARAVPVLPSEVVSPASKPVVAPLGSERYRVQFTASGELRRKLARLQALMQGDLAEVIEAAVTEKLERLEAKRYAETKAPRKNLEQTDTSPRSRYIPAAVRRAVRKRDGDRCRFVSEQGRRCTETRGLEFHHHDPFGRGGDHDPDNVSLRCRRHNEYQAERDYGKDVFDSYRGRGNRVSEPEPILLDILMAPDLHHRQAYDVSAPRRDQRSDRYWGSSPLFSRVRRLEFPHL